MAKFSEKQKKTKTLLSLKMKIVPLSLDFISQVQQFLVFFVICAFVSGFMCVISR